MMDIRWTLLAFFLCSKYFENCSGVNAQKGYSRKALKLQRLRLNKDEDLEEFGYNFKKHNAFETIENYLKELTNKHQELTSLEIVRNSYEGRPIYAVYVGDTKTKPLIVFECTMHAREWTAVETCMYFLKMLVDQKSRSTKQMLSTYGFIIMPLLNPDGYVYSWKYDPMWRKTRNCEYGKKNCTGKCVGIDGNRNFPSAKMKFCYDRISSTDPCRDTYCGEEPLSVNESLAVRDMLDSVKGRLFAYMCIHSTAGMWLLPYAKNGKVPRKFYEMKRVAELAAKEMYRKTGKTPYKVGTASKLLYSTVGTSYDYAVDYGKASYSYTVEMRGKNDDGPIEFALEEEDIYDVISEMFIGLKTAILAMQKN